MAKRTTRKKTPQKTETTKYIQRQERKINYLSLSNTEDNSNYMKHLEQNKYSYQRNFSKYYNINKSTKMVTQQRVKTSL